MLSLIQVIDILGAIEATVAELDTLFNQIMFYRSKRILIDRRTDKILFKTYIIVNSILQYLSDSLIQTDSPRYMPVANISTYYIASNKTQNPSEALYLSLRRIHRRIRIVRSAIRKLKEIAEFLTQLNIIRRIDPDDIILYVLDYGPIIGILTSRRIIIFNRKTRALISLLLKEIKAITYKRSFIGRGCEIVLRDGNSIKLPINSDHVYELKRLIDEVNTSRRNITSRPEYIKNILSKFKRIHPSVLLLKLNILRRFMSSSSGISG